MSATDEVSDMFDTESQKLVNLINTASVNPNLSIHEIVETYYQIMNVSSMITMLKQQIGTHQKPLSEKISETEKIISDKFNSQIHPKIMNNLTESIQEITKTIQSKGNGKKSKEEIDNEAKLYDELRQKMSTKEFAEQYDKGI